jgi:hypothetical protein
MQRKQFMSSHQTTGQNYKTKVSNKCFENMTKLKYLGMIVTNHNFITEEIKSRLNSENACYHEVQNLL